jgi:hypothetical protein
MMNFKSISGFRLRQGAMLARFIVAGTGGSPVANPVFPVIRKITTFPRGALLAAPMFTIPISHALTGAERILGGLGVAPSESLAAPFTIQDPTSPSKQNKATFRTACYLSVLAIWFRIKHLSADRAGNAIEGFLFRLRRLLAFTGAKPFPIWVMFQKPVFSGGTLAASGACNLYNHLRISYIKCQMIASENFNLLWERMTDAFPNIEIKRLS